MSSFIAAGTSYSAHKVNMIPFFIYYSMFGFQRIGDLVWAAGDMRTKGFLLGGTSGRTTLAGEGLQHQDGNSHILAYPVPNLKAYDPAFAYEVAVIVRDGLYRMYEKGEDVFYYITVMNEFYPMPEMPRRKGIKEGILKGMYRFKKSDNNGTDVKAHLFGSGTIMNEAIKAAEMLEKDYGVSADVWNITSYKELYRDAIDIERWNMLNPEKEQKENYIQQTLKNEKGVFVAASDYIKALPASISQWIPGPFTMLGTDGFGRSESRDRLRDFFEVDARYIVAATLGMLAKQGKVKTDLALKAIKDLKLKQDKPNPIIS